MRRVFKGMQLEDWTRLGGLTHLKLWRVYLVVLPGLLHLTTLRSLVLSDWPVSG